MYPTHSYAGYHANTMGGWNQASVPQNSQGIGYALSYAHPEVTTYVEKATFSNPYGTLYATADTDYYRHSYPNPASQQPGQWPQSGFQQYMFAPQYRRSVTDCYDRHRPNMPNTARPPPSMKTDNSDNTFHASLSMLENPTQNSAAAYTASWVSSTSSIPPELRDEPEVPSFNGSAHSGCRDDLAAGASAVFTPPVSTFADQFSNMSIIEKDGEVLNTSWEDCATLPSQQWPGLGQDGDGGGVPGGQGRRRKTEDRDRRGRESPKELTWEERIRKGAVQKERVEQRGLEKPEKTERDVREINLGSGRQRGQRGRPTNPDGCRIQRGGSARLPLLSPVPPIERENTQCRHGQAVRISAPRSNRLCERDGHFDAGPPRMVPMHAPQYYNHGAPLLMGRGAYYRPGPPVVCVPQQDQRFRNTWLDANLGLNYPQVQMVDYAFSPCCVFRARPNFGGRSGYRCTSRYANSARDSTRTQPHEGGVRETKVDEEEVWLCEAEEEKQNRCANNVDWSPGKEGPENGVPRGSTIIENREKGEDDEKEDRCKDNNIRSDILTPNDEADTLKTAASA